MNLKSLSNIELHQQTLTRAERERIVTTEVLWHLRENEKRMLYAEMGYRDLKEYCIKELKYSEGSAWRRINAMRLLKEIPEMEVKIQTGELNLTQIAMASSHFREVKAHMEEKKSILNQLTNQSTRSTERILAEQKPEPVTPRPEVIEKPIKGEKIEVTLIIDLELEKELEEIQVLLGKPYSKLELLKMMTKQTLEKLKIKNQRISPRTAQPSRKHTAAENQILDGGKSNEPQSNSTQIASQKTSRHISRFTLREIKARDAYRCQYRDPKTKRQCEAKYHLQAEHINPFAKGGSHKNENLQLLCPAHNRLRAVQQYGYQKMKRYIPSLQ